MKNENNKTKILFAWKRLKKNADERLEYRFQN